MGLAGSADMRALLKRVERGRRSARLAVDVYLHRLRASIAAMAAALGGLEALVFTGGVGENAPLIRQRACAGLGFLGLQLDATRNRDPHGDADISERGSPVRLLVVKAREDIEIARETRAVFKVLRASAG